MSWAHEQIQAIQRQLADQEKRIARLETQAGYYETFVDDVWEVPHSPPMVLEALQHLKNQLDTIDEEGV